MTGLGVNFTMGEIASSANSYANYHYDIFPGLIQYTFTTHSFYS